MIKVYMSPLCIDCRNLVAVVKNRGLGDKFEFINITESTENLKEFLTLRDHHDAFLPKRTAEDGSKIGIPAFVSENGAIAFEADEALAWLGEAPVKDEEILEWR